MRFNYFHAKFSSLYSFIFFIFNQAASLALPVSRSVFSVIGAFFCINMAMNTTILFGHWSSGKIYRISDCLKMFWINASRVIAQVIYDQFFRYISKENVITNSVSESISSFKTKSTISIRVFTSSPKPASFSFINFIKKSFNHLYLLLCSRRHVQDIK